MGWDFYTYESQPNRFLEEISLIMYQESQAESERLKSKSSSFGSGIRRG